MSYYFTCRKSNGCEPPFVKIDEKFISVMFRACFTQANVQGKAFWSSALIGYSDKV